MRLRWTPGSAADLQDINDYLKENHPHFRQFTMRKLYETIRSLKSSPLRGRATDEGGTRAIMSPPLPYVVVYRVTDGTVEILRVHHGAQNFRVI